MGEKITPRSSRRARSKDLEEWPEKKLRVLRALRGRKEINVPKTGDQENVLRIQDKPAFKK